MRKFMAFALIIVASTFNARAQQNPPVPPPPTNVISASQTNVSLKLAWDASPDGGIEGYNIYRGLSPENYVETNWAGTNLQWTLTNVVSIIGITNYFAATAVGTNKMESDFSNEIWWTAIRPRPPTLRSKLLVTLVFEMSDNLNDWKQVGVGPELVFDAPEAPVDGSFIRVKLNYRPVYGTQ